MAVMGLEAFRERFKEYEDCYTMIYYHENLVDLQTLLKCYNSRYRH